MNNQGPIESLKYFLCEYAARGQLQTEAAASAVAELETALRQWKCPACGGRGEYEHHGQKGEYERTGRVRLPHPANKTTACKKCDGSGLHPIAAEMLERIKD